jgi:DNA repair protein RecO (recombination protein O)
MGQVDTEAIVLRTYKLSEADKIAVCLTEKAGVVRGVARGARRLKSRFGAGLEPFTLVHLDYYFKEHKELVTYRHAEIIRSYFDLAANTDVFSSFEYMSELLIEFAPQNEPNPVLFRMVRASIEAMGQTPEDFEWIIKYFEVWLLKLSGFLPDLKSCSMCRRQLKELEAGFLKTSNSFICPACAEGGGQRISSQARAQLLYILRLAPADFLKTTDQVEGEAREEIYRFTRILIMRALEKDKERPYIIPSPVASKAVDANGTTT